MVTRHKILTFTITMLCTLFTYKVFYILENYPIFNNANYSYASDGATSATLPELPAVVNDENNETSTDTKKIGENIEDTASKVEVSENNQNQGCPEKEFSFSEIEILKNLSKRRNELEKLEYELTNKQEVINTTELRIDNKISELKNLQQEVNKLLDEYKKKESENLQSLVKIYENMKPKDAAKIFEELDMVILVEVINKMKELKVAPILSNMNPAKARELTINYAKNKNVDLANEE